uniref:Uncharacterized protein n=2 Tax=Aspergillus niger TaxID=5061 RepID=A0A9W6EGV8_ASPNG|nr:hypothetical protein AnigIFM63604_002926 [Aspergillus niger]
MGFKDEQQLNQNNPSWRARMPEVRCRLSQITTTPYTRPEHEGNVTITSDLSNYRMLVRSVECKMNTSADSKTGADANSVESRSYGWPVSTIETKHQQQSETSVFTGASTTVIRLIPRVSAISEDLPEPSMEAQESEFARPRGPGTSRSPKLGPQYAGF